MAGSKADFLENKLLDHVLGAATYTPPVTVYIALYTVAPSDAGGGTEVTGGSYARVAVTNNATNFPAATASWGTVVAHAELDAPTGGNFLYWGDLTVSKAINSGDTASFAVGDLDFTED